MENLVYCDYIANVVSESLQKDSAKNLKPIVTWVTKPKLDLHPEEGYMLSTKKTVSVLDANGRLYNVTVEEA